MPPRKQPGRHTTSGTGQLHLILQLRELLLQRADSLCPGVDHALPAHCQHVSRGHHARPVPPRQLYVMQRLGDLTGHPPNAAVSTHARRSEQNHPLTALTGGGTTLPWCGREHPVRLCPPSRALAVACPPAGRTTARPAPAARRSHRQSSPCELTHEGGCFYLSIRVSPGVSRPAAWPSHSFQSMDAPYLLEVSVIRGGRILPEHPSRVGCACHKHTRSRRQVCQACMLRA